MPTFTKTITNSVNLFGLNPSNKWGEAIPIYTMTWGVTKWGEGTYPNIFSVIKYASSSVSPDTTLVRSVSKLIEDSIAPDTAIVKQVTKPSIDFGSVAVTSDPSSEQLSVGIWKVVFASDTTEAEDRDFPTWDQSAAVSASFTCAAAGSTIWS